MNQNGRTSANCGTSSSAEGVVRTQRVARLTNEGDYFS
jgi:hypothetical protein